MDWSLIFVFLYVGALTHFVADFLSHWFGETDILIVIHSFLYTIFFIPVFWFVNIHYFWLVIIFGSHLIIDSQRGYLSWIINEVLKKENVEEKMKKIITLGLDQVIHLLVLLIIALLALR